MAVAHLLGPNIELLVHAVVYGIPVDHEANGCRCVMSQHHGGSKAYDEA